MKNDENYKSGNGTYEIKDYTLVLNYNDDRIVKLAFYKWGEAEKDVLLFLDKWTLSAAK